MEREDQQYNKKILSQSYLQKITSINSSGKFLLFLMTLLYCSQLQFVGAFCRNKFPTFLHKNRQTFMKDRKLAISNKKFGTKSKFSMSILNDFSSIKDSNNKANIIFVLGGPGAGKGTQCERLSREFGIAHLSAGELLRQERLTGSEQGQLIESYLKEGRIVPVEVSLGLLKKEITGRGHSRYLIDGFPRNHDNLDGWLKLMPSACEIEMIMFLDCKEAELERRILERGLTSNRSDDNINTAKKRFLTFQSETMPVVRHFDSEMSQKFKRVNGDRPVDLVYKDLRDALVPSLEEELKILNHKMLGLILSGNFSSFSNYYKENSNIFHQETEALKLAFKSLDSIEVQINSGDSHVDGTIGRFSCSLSTDSGCVEIVREWGVENGKWSLHKSKIFMKSN